MHQPGEYRVACMGGVMVFWWLVATYLASHFFGKDGALIVFFAPIVLFVAIVYMTPIIDGHIMLWKKWRNRNA